MWKQLRHWWQWRSLPTGGVTPGGPGRLPPKWRHNLTHNRTQNHTRTFIAALHIKGTKTDAVTQNICPVCYSLCLDQKVGESGVIPSPLCISWNFQTIMEFLHRTFFLLQETISGYKVSASDFLFWHHKFCHINFDQSVNCVINDRSRATGNSHSGSQNSPPPSFSVKIPENSRYENM